MSTTVSSDMSNKPSEAVLIAFQLGRVISFLCVIFGTLGNTALIIVICRTLFLHLPYGILLGFIAIFDLLRLWSVVFYYALQAGLVALTLPTVTVCVSFYRYPKVVTNWLKIFLAIERLIAIKYWTTHRYNVNTTNMTARDRLRRRRTLFAIAVLLVCILITEHPIFIPNRFTSVSIDPSRLLIVSEANLQFYYGNQVFNGGLFNIIGYVILDNCVPILVLVISNAILLYELHHLSTMTKKKLAESIWILFFLTIFSIFALPCSFIVIFNSYVNQEYINDTSISVVFNTFQGLEMINHALTGYACFLSCRTLRKGLVRLIQIPYEKIKSKRWKKNSTLTPAVIELHMTSADRF